MQEIEDLIKPRDPISRELKATFQQQTGADYSVGMHESRRINFEHNNCLQIALRLRSNIDVKSKAVCSIGGIEACFFLTKSCSQAVVFDCDVNPKLPVFKDSRVELHTERFTPNTENKIQFELLIASYLFDSGSQLVDRWDRIEEQNRASIERNTAYKRLDFLKEDLEEQRTTVETDRRKRGLSIPEYCTLWKLDPHDYADAIRVAATGLAFNSEGYSEELLIEKLDQYKFSETDKNFIIQILRPQLDDQEKEYVAYAQAMWKLVSYGGAFIFDGNKSELVSQHLQQAQLTIFSIGFFKYSKHLVIAEKLTK